MPSRKIFRPQNYGAVAHALPVTGRVSDRKIVARYPDVSRDQVERRRSPDYQDFTTSSVFRGTGQPPTRSALLTANWRGCEGGRRGWAACRRSVPNCVLSI